MSHFPRWIIPFLSCLCLLIACASPKAPTGGVKDIAPPVIIEEESTPNKQKNFHQKEITIVFDEWVTLKDIYTQLVISPLMPHNPDIRQKGKGIIIKLPDSLHEETTYTINFGNAIADLNEGNVLENYAFVFSTGSTLDSVKLAGSVTNASNLSPATDMWVMLYPVGDDSAVYKRKPEYLAKTNKEGKWTLSNVRTDSFVVIALKDENQNLIYDQENELIGWSDSIIYTNLPEYRISPIRVFPREASNKVKEIIHYAPGWLKLIISASDPKPFPEFLPVLDSTTFYWDHDTLQVWYNPVNNYAGYAILNLDSTRIRATTSPSLIGIASSISITSGRIQPGGKVSFKSDLPILQIDTSKIMLHHDSLGIIPYTIERNKNDARRFDLNAVWKEKVRYNLTFLPGAIYDFWGRTNDTIRQSVVVTGADQFGEMIIMADGMDSLKHYILLIKNGEQIMDTFVMHHQSTAQFVKKGLMPGKYTLEMIEDLNENGVWDTGNFLHKKQPERKMFFAPDNLRAGWELEVKVTWSKN